MSVKASHFTFITAVVVLSGVWVSVPGSFTGMHIAAAADSSPSPAAPSDAIPAYASLAAVDVKVQRIDPVTHAPLTLPAALVPKLQRGDIVMYSLPSYDLRSGGGVERVIYHSDVAFVNGAGDYKFRYEHRDPDNPQITGRNQSDMVSAGPMPRVFSVGRYDPSIDGTPVIFIVPEDEYAGQIGAVRAELRADGKDAPVFKDSIALGTQASHSTWLADFISAMANNSVNLDGSGRSFISSVMTNDFNVDASKIKDCYSKTGDVVKRQCLAQETIAAEKAKAQTPDSAALLGRLSSVGVRPALSPYVFIASQVLTVIMPQKARVPYQYVPTTLLWEPRQGSWSSTDGVQRLVLKTTPNIRRSKDTTVHSDVPFVVLNATQPEPTPPAISIDKKVDESRYSDTSICLAEGSTIPFRLSSTSPFLHDVEISGFPGGAVQVPMGTFSDFKVPPGHPIGPGAAYDVHLAAHFGFSALSSPTLHVAIARNSDAWALDSSSWPPETGSSGRLIYRTKEAPCVDHADLHGPLGESLPSSLKPIFIDDSHVAFDVPKLTGWSVGTAQLVVTRKEAYAGQTFTDRMDQPLLVSIGNIAPVISTVRAYNGDREVAIVGTGLSYTDAFTIASTSYKNDGSGTDQAACYTSALPVSDASNGTLQYGKRARRTSLTVGRRRPDVLLRVIPDQIAGAFVLPSGTLDASVPFSIRYSISNSVVSTPMAWRAVLPGQSACDALFGRVGQVVSVLAITGATPSTGTMRFAQGAIPMLAANAGRIQLAAVVNGDPANSSDWVDVPVTFLKVPTNFSISCTGSSCFATGDNLDRIHEVRDPARPTRHAVIACDSGRPCPLLGIEKVSTYEVLLSDDSTWATWTVGRP